MTKKWVAQNYASARERERERESKKRSAFFMIKQIVSPVRLHEPFGHSFMGVPFLFYKTQKI
jgi:hypothetical protein